LRHGIDQFATADVDIYDLAARLRTKGPSRFVNSWNELMGCHPLQSATLAKARYDTGRFRHEVLVVDVGGTHVKILAYRTKPISEFPLRAPR